MKLRRATLHYRGTVFQVDTRPAFEQTGAWVLEDVTGWYGGVDVRSETTDRLHHGQFPQRAWRGSRALTLKATYVAKTPDERLFLMRSMSGLLEGGDFGTLTVETDQTLSCEVRLDGEVGLVELGTHGLQLQVPLYAPDPYLYSPWRESYLRPIGAGVGLEYAPFSKGGVLTFGTAVASEEWVWNDGNADSTPVFEVTAESQGFAVGLGNKRVTYPWPTFPDMPVTIDMAGALTVGGMDQSHLLGERAWSSVPPHSMERPFFEFLRGGEGWAIARHRDTLI